MSSQNSDFLTLSQINRKSYQEALMILEEDTLLVKKLESLHIISTKYVPRVSQNSLESEILCRLMPQAKEVLLSIFERAIDLAMHSEHENVQNHTLHALKENFQMAINLLQVLNSLMDFVISKSKVNLSDIHSIPLNVSKILYSTFLHCKESQNFYNIYFDSLDEVLVLFKLAQEIHEKLLQCLDVHIVFNLLYEDHLVMMKLVLETLVEIGAIMAEMNVKSMVCNFKAYIILTSKHANELGPVFSIQQPFNFCSKEIVKNLEAVTQPGILDDKNVTQLIKLINFLIKLMLKLCSLFWQSLKACFEEVWKFLISFYGYYETQLIFKGVPQGTIQLIKTQMFDYIDQFISKLSSDVDFLQVTTFNECVYSSNNIFGFLVLFNLLFEKLLAQNEAVDMCRKIDVPSILELFFEAVNKCYAEIVIDDNICENLITTTSALIILSNDYSRIESVLFKNLFKQSIWCSVIAADIWILVLSHSPAHHKYETLINIITKSISTTSLYFTYSPNLNILYNFIKRLYQTLSNKMKMKFSEKFPPITYIHIWKHIGFHNFPANDATKLLSSLTDKMEKFDADKCSQDEFISMCDHMEAASTINFEEICLDVNKLSLLTMKLWDFDASDCALIDNNFFKLYIQSLCILTNSLIWKWNSDQLLQIFQQLKLLLNNNTTIKLLLLQILGTISTKFFENSSKQSAINSILSDYFTILFDDCNPVIRQDTLEVFISFVNNGSFDDVIHNSLNNRIDLKELVSNFMQKKKFSSDVNYIPFLKSLGEKQFMHRCVEWSNSAPQSKKLKMQNVEAVSVLKRIKNDVNHFCQLCEKSELTEENLTDISSILSQLQLYV